jgi:hypothetical protein
MLRGFVPSIAALTPGAAVVASAVFAVIFVGSVAWAAVPVCVVLASEAVPAPPTPAMLCSGVMGVATGVIDAAVPGLGTPTLPSSSSKVTPPPPASVPFGGAGDGAGAEGSGAVQVLDAGVGLGLGSGPTPSMGPGVCVAEGVWQLGCWCRLLVLELVLVLVSGAGVLAAV